MLRGIRAWWAKRKRDTQEKYAEDHAWVDPTDLEAAKKNFEYRTPRQPRR
jgi:hypothetical protein